MQINKVAFIGKGGVGLLYGSMIARALGNDAVDAKALYYQVQTLTAPLCLRKQQLLMLRPDRRFGKQFAQSF